MVPFYEGREPRHVSTFFLLVFFSVSIFQRVKREREEKKREERELFFLGFGSSSPIFSSLPQKIQKILSTQNELCLRVKVAHVAYDPTKRTKALLFSTSLVFCSLRLRFDVSVRANIL